MNTISADSKAEAPTLWSALVEKLRESIERCLATIDA
jgi:hypothetical protein